MEMEQWDEGNTVSQNHQNVNAVDYNGDNTSYHQNDYEYNYNNNNQDDYSNQSNNNNNYNYNYNDNYSNYNRRCSVSNNNNNNNNYRHKHYRSRQYNNYNNNGSGGYRGNRNEKRGRAKHKYHKNNSTRGIYTRNANTYYNNDNMLSYQSQHNTDTNQNNDNDEQTQINNEPTRPSKSFTRKKKFSGRQIEEDVNQKQIQHNNNNNNNCHNHNIWVDESQPQINTYTNNQLQMNQNKYLHKQKRNQSNALELENLGDRPKEMALQLMNGTYDCMVCQSFIGKKARIWKCKHCYIMFHITCINKWARAREQKDAQSEQRIAKSDHQINTIRCPACNYVDTNFKFNQYKCFCGQVIFDHIYRSTYHHTSIIPHSCGDICNRQRGPLCPHTCGAICHPGPCQPCTLPSNRTSSCPCGKLTHSLLCGDAKENKARLCHQICNKILKCGHHKCEMQCHEGQCKPCDIKSKQHCFCGKQNKLQACGTGIKCNNNNNNEKYVWKYSCNKICNKQLLCKHHQCKLICHNGPCSDCPRPITTPTRCACDKSTLAHIQRTSCLDALPICKKKCGKQLGCGNHWCRKPCHDSKCKLCMVQIKKQCRCGASTKKFKCYDYEKRSKSFHNSQNLNSSATSTGGKDSWIRCGKKCKRVKSCGKHECTEICCVGRTHTRTYYSAHQCQLICNKALACGRHKCGSYCHRGLCNPCGVTYRNGVTCACGNVYVAGPFQCGTKKIAQCNSICDKVLACAHSCASKCHSGACPPCSRICSKACVSHGLLVHNMPCHVENRSCGTQCGKIFACKIHKCNRICHGGICVGGGGGNNNKGCGQICDVVLRCGHKCMYKCHGYGNKCNANFCKVQITVKCACGKNSDQQYCRGRTEYELKAIPCSKQCKNW